MEKLTEKEFDFCKKLQEKLNKKEATNEIQRKEMLDFIKEECNKKKYIVDFQLHRDDDLQIYKFLLNEKLNFIVFDKFHRVSVNLIPAGIIND